MMDCFWIVRGLHLAFATVFVDVAGLGKNIIPLLLFRSSDRCVRIETQSVRHFWEDRWKGWFGTFF